MTDKDKDFVRSYIADATTEEERKARRKECASQFEVSLPTIAAISAWTTIWGKAKSQPIACHVDYDNSIKQSWRERWKIFLEKNIFPSERAKQKVLCLPGKKCLEIPLYLELGYRPENITGVEGGDECAKHEFLQAAGSFGINPRLCRLEELVKEPELYDVISLDFTGAICKNYVDIIKNLPIVPAVTSRINTNSYLMVNVMGKREQENAQQMMDYYAYFTNDATQEMMGSINSNLRKEGTWAAFKAFTAVDKSFDEIRDRVIAGETIDERELKEKRDISLPFIISSHVGSTKWRNNPDYAGYIAKFQEYESKGTDCVEIFTQAVKGLTDLLVKSASERFTTMFISSVAQLVQMSSDFRPFTLDIEEYEYISPVGNTPFLSEMFHFYTPLADYGKLRHIIRFMFDIVLWVAAHPEEQIAMFAVRDKKGNLSHDSLTINDTIEFTTANRQKITSVSVKNIIQAENVMYDNVGRDKIADYVLGKNKLERINLSCT